MDTITKLRRYMTPIPYTVTPDMKVRAALELMRRHGIKHLPVEEGERLVGIISDWDILAAPSIDRVLGQDVRSIMIRDPLRLTTDAPIEVALRIMSREGVGSILVVDAQERIMGIFTEKDAVRAWADHTGEGEPLQGHRVQ